MNLKLFHLYSPTVKTKTVNITAMSVNIKANLVTIKDFALSHTLIQINPKNLQN